MCEKVVEELNYGSVVQITALLTYSMEQSPS